MGQNICHHTPRVKGKVKVSLRNCSKKRYGTQGELLRWMLEIEREYILLVPGKGTQVDHDV